MNSRTPTSSPSLFSRMVAIGLGLFAAALYVGCGRMPEEPFWEPNAEDTTAIESIVQANKALFMTSFAEGSLAPLDTALSDTNKKRLKKEMTENPFKQRFRTNGLQHLFFTDSFDLEYRFVATLDTAKAETTCTVFMAETIPGLLRLHAYSYTRFLRDSVIGTDTLKFYDTVFSAIDTVIEKRLNATTLDGCVLKKEGGQWKLWKRGGASRLYAPTPDDAPYLDRIFITNGRKEDTFMLRPDTLHHGVQRFYADDELPTFTVGDSIYVRSLLTTVVDAKNLLYFDGERHEFKSSDKIALTRPGLFRLYVEQIPIDVLYEMGGTYVGLVWGAWIRVVE
ncbi:MAG: hypothetical protein ABIL25_03060 [candidate division WOR-3 bacterium]